MVKNDRRQHPFFVNHHQVELLNRLMPAISTRIAAGPSSPRWHGS
jgi:hypothetical protein